MTTIRFFSQKILAVYACSLGHWLSATPIPSGAFPEVQDPSNLGVFIKDRAAAIRLGKAFFWDMQAGSDGVVACATCHHSAFSDRRQRNQMHPGPNGAFLWGSANLRLEKTDFPIVGDDTVGSQGVRKAKFVDITLGEASEAYIEEHDPIFSSHFFNVRQVTNMNAPSVINAIFNHRSFWDGRASSIFNGFSSYGEHDPEAKDKIWEVRAGQVRPTTVKIETGSTASQAVGPMLNSVEMSYSGRTWPKIAKKLFHLVPLGKQIVHNDDSVLGSLVGFQGYGLRLSYVEMIKLAFRENWWRSATRFRLDQAGNPTIVAPEDDWDPTSTDVFNLMEINFSLFWGLAIQLYEATLVSDKTAFDQFRTGVPDPRFDDLVQTGMKLFYGKAQCSECHREVLLSSASSENINKLGVSIKRFTADGGEAFLDTGYFNIAVRPTSENLGIAGLSPFGKPLSFSKEIHPTERLAIEGAFKAPGLRNTWLTGLYFHKGNKATLDQVLDFYKIKGDFYAENFRFMNINMRNIDFDNNDKIALEAFLRIGLTDERVANESGPFDHPNILLPDGVDLFGYEEFIYLPAIGRRGRLAEGIPPLGELFY